MTLRIALFVFAVIASTSQICLSLPTSGCEIDGKVYAEGEAWSDGCVARCRCYRSEETGEYHSGCVSMCPPMQVMFPCTLEEHPDKNEENSTNCCPVPVCPDKCKINGQDVSIGGSLKVGCSMTCWCAANDDVPYFWCLPACPLSMPREGCHLEDDPEKDESTSSNCCPVEVCD